MKLGDVVDIVAGQSPESKFYNTNRQGLPFLQGVTEFGDRYPHPTVYCSQPIKFAKPGDILFSVRAPVGDVNIAKDEYCIGRGVAAIRMKKGSDDFLYYLLNNLSRAFKSVSGGTTYESINKDQIADMEVMLPSEPEQNRIADFLNLFDRKIEVNNRISATLEEIAKAIFKEWFVDFRFPAHEKAEFVDSELGRIPKGWKIMTVGEVAKLNKGLSYTSEEISEHSDGLPLVNLKCFARGGGFRLDGLKFYHGEYDERHIVEPGQIVIALTDLTPSREVVGRPAIVPRLNEEKTIVISLDVCSIEVSPDIRDYLYYSMRRPEFGNFMANSATGTTVAHLNPSRIEEFRIMLPDAGSLAKFREQVDPQLAWLDHARRENIALAEMRDTLLPKLMNGTLRI